MIPFTSTLLSMFFACHIGGNTPPRFQTFNDEEVKYIFGIAYLPSNIFSGLFLEAQQRWNFTLEVSDSNGDDIEILFPQAPGQIQFNSHTNEGYWDIPLDVANTYPTFQVLAVDAQGASDILFLDLQISGGSNELGWDSGWLDTGWDWIIDDPYSPRFLGEINLENGFRGSITYVNSVEHCTITWSEIEGQALAETTACPYCTNSWTIPFTQGESPSPTTLCQRYNQRLSQQGLTIGYAERAEWDGYTYEDVIFYQHPTLGWVPYGQGSISQQRLSFSMNVDQN